MFTGIITDIGEIIDIKDNDLKIIKQMMINIIGQDSSYLRNNFNIL